MSIARLIHRAVQKGQQEEEQTATVGRLNSDGSYTYEVTGRPSRWYVTIIENGTPTTVADAEPRGGLRLPAFPVILRSDPRVGLYIYGPDGETALQYLAERSAAAAYAPAHGDSHHLLGGDPVLIDAGQFLPGLVAFVSGTTVRVGTLDANGTTLQPTVYQYDGVLQILPVTELDWSAEAAAITSGMRAWLAIVIDPVTNGLDVLVGDEYAIGIVPLDKALVADIDFTGVLPLMAFEARSGQTTPPDATDLFDLRPFAGTLYNATGMTSFTVAGDSGTPQSITDGNTLAIAGGTNLNSVASATDTITLNLDAAPTISDFTNMQHDHLDTDDGGLLSTSAISGFTEAVQDVMGALLADSAEIDYTYDDAGNALTVGLIRRQGTNPGGRLTTVSGSPVDVSAAASTVYYTPYMHTLIPLYDGATWIDRTFAEISIKLQDAQTGTRASGSPIITGLTDTSQLIPGMLATGTGMGAAAAIATIDSPTQVTLTVNSVSSGTATVTFSVPASTNLDIFAYNNSGTPKLEMVKWTSATARATALARQDGKLIKSGTATRLYLGTVRTYDTDGFTYNSEQFSFVWNNYNRTVRRMHQDSSITGTAAHNYGSTTVRPWGNDTVNRIQFITGLVEDHLSVNFVLRMFGNAATGYAGIGTATNAFVDLLAAIGVVDSTDQRVGGLVGFIPTLGLNSIRMNERGNATGSGPEFTSYYLDAFMPM